MPSVLRFPVNQAEDPSDLPESGEGVFTPPPDLVEQPNPPRGTTATRRSSATIVPEVSFDEPTRPADHPGPDLDGLPWFETTATSAPEPGDDDGFVDPAADTDELPPAATGEVSEEAPRASLPLLLAASGVMILLAGTAVMLVLAMLQRPEPVSAAAAVAPAMVAPMEALPAPTIADPAPVEAAPAPPPAAAVKRTKKKAPSIQEMAPPVVTITTPAVEAAPEPEPTVAETTATDADEKKKKGLFGKKNR
jgi:hypothetical protein